MSRDLIFLLYGEGYSYAPLYLALYTVNFLFAGIGSTVLGSFFSGVGDSKVNLKATLLYVCLFTPSAIALTSTLHVEGLLIATITATAASVLYSLWIAIRKYGLRVDIKSSAKIYLASLLAATPIIPITLYSPLPRIANLAASAIIYLTVYLIATPLLKILTREDVETLTRIFTKVAVLRPITRIISNYEVKVMNLIEAGLKSHKAFYR